MGVGMGVMCDSRSASVPCPSYFPHTKKRSLPSPVSCKAQSPFNVQRRESILRPALGMKNHVGLSIMGLLLSVIVVIFPPIPAKRDKYMNYRKTVIEFSQGFPFSKESLVSLEPLRRN